MKLLNKSIMKGLITFSLAVPFLAQAEVHPGKVLHDDANCMKCHADLGYNNEKTKRMTINTYGDIAKAVAFCDSNLNVGWFPDESAEVVDYLNKAYYKLPKE